MFESEGVSYVIVLTKFTHLKLDYEDYEANKFQKTHSLSEMTGHPHKLIFLLARSFAWYLSPRFFSLYLAGCHHIWYTPCDQHLCLHPYSKP